MLYRDYPAIDGYCEECGEILRSWGFHSLARRCESECFFAEGELICPLCENLLVNGENEEDMA